jgi:hypothetical protein
MAAISIPIPRPAGPDIYGGLTRGAGASIRLGISTVTVVGGAGILAIEGIGKALAPLINALMMKNQRKLKESIRQFVTRRLSMQPEVQALKSPASPKSLNAMLGITPIEGEAAVNAIINEITNAIKIDIIKVNSKLKGGGVSISIVSADMQKIANFSVGTKNIGKGFLSFLGSSDKLNWLHWLLMRGDSPIIIGYSYLDLDGKGRTGGGIMRKGGSFRVPPEYSGTENDNFITRAFDNPEAESELRQIIENTLFS